jgi:hypothetical protein
LDLGFILSKKKSGPDTINKNASDLKKICDKFKKFYIHKFFLEIRKNSYKFWVLLAGKLFANFSLKVLIVTQFEKYVEIVKVRKFWQNYQDFSCLFVGRTKPWLVLARALPPRYSCMSNIIKSV